MSAQDQASSKQYIAKKGQPTSSTQQVNQQNADFSNQDPAIISVAAQQKQSPQHFHDSALIDDAIISTSKQTNAGGNALQKNENLVINADGKSELEHSFTYWIYQKTMQQTAHLDWESQIKPIAKFNTAEDFWEIYQFLKRPSQLQNGTTVHLFVDDIKPMWEDEANKLGGRWVIRMNKGFSNKLWEDLTLAMIGEQFELENEIHGIVIVIKPNGDTIAVWNKNSRDQAVVDQIKADLIRVLNLPDDVKMDYEQFNPETPQQKQQPQGNWGQGQGQRREERKERPNRGGYGDQNVGGGSNQQQQQQYQQQPGNQSQQNLQQQRYKAKGNAGGQPENVGGAHRGPRNDQQQQQQYKKPQQQ